MSSEQLLKVNHGMRGRRHTVRRIDFLLLIVWTLCFAAAPVGDDYGRSLIGTKPPELRNVTWLTGESHRLSDFRGKVVLIRWWTAGGCPFCKASAGALNRFAEEFAGKDLVVIGLYHHKLSAPLAQDYVIDEAQRLGFRFLVGIDYRWENLNRWWLETGDRGWTSVTFLLDREGVIRAIHPGGVYTPEPSEIFPKAYEDYQALRSSMTKLLGGGKHSPE